MNRSLFICAFLWIYVILKKVQSIETFVLQNNFLRKVNEDYYESQLPNNFGMHLLYIRNIRKK